MAQPGELGVDSPRMPADHEDFVFVGPEDTGRDIGRVGGLRDVRDGVVVAVGEFDILAEVKVAEPRIYWWISSSCLVDYGRKTY